MNMSCSVMADKSKEARSRHGVGTQRYKTMSGQGHGGELLTFTRLTIAVSNKHDVHLSTIDIILIPPISSLHVGM